MWKVLEMKSLPLLLIYTIFLIIGDSVLMLALKFYFYSQYRVNALTNRRTKKKMSAVARSVLQQCISARLMVQPATGSEPAQYVEVSGNTVNKYWKNEEENVN